MACTKQTYTASATWTASQLADVFRDAFIDAGLMAAWHASFLSGSIENRVLRVQYDASKTYGTTFYWFQFSTTGAYLHVATGWDTATNQPSGTQYLDYFSTTTSSTSNHWIFASPSSTSTVILDRYTSGVDNKQSWFLLRWSTSRFVFTIAHPGSTRQSWLNLDRGQFVGFAHAAPSTAFARGTLDFRRGPALRRDLFIGAGLVGTTSLTNYAATAASNHRLLGYGAVGHVSNSSDNFAFATPHILLPVGFSATNPAYPANSNPVFHSLPYTPYLVDSLPSDFGISFHYATNTFSPGDTFVVSAGVEEWEVLDFAANSTAVNGASPLFLARMI